MSQFIQLLKNITPGTPTITRKEGRFKKFHKTNAKSTSDAIFSGTSNLSRRRSKSTSALSQLNEDEINDPFVEDVKHSQMRSSSSNISNIESTNETELKSPLTVKELIEQMITHLQVLERKNEILTNNVQLLSEQKSTLESDLSSTKVELNLYKNRLKQIEQIANEWHCSICTDNKNTIITSKRILVSTFCGHVFCSTCAQSLLNGTRPSKQCPTCRKPLKEGQLNYHPIFI